LPVDQRVSTLSSMACAGGAMASLLEAVTTHFDFAVIGFLAHVCVAGAPPLPPPPVALPPAPAPPRVPPTPPLPPAPPLLPAVPPAPACVAPAIPPLPAPAPPPVTPPLAAPALPPPAAPPEPAKPAVFTADTPPAPELPAAAGEVPPAPASVTPWCTGSSMYVAQATQEAPRELQTMARRHDPRNARMSTSQRKALRLLQRDVLERRRELLQETRKQGEKSTLLRELGFGAGPQITGRNP
jgi:hypothetical protein